MDVKSNLWTITPYEVPNSHFLKWFPITSTWFTKLSDMMSLNHFLYPLNLNQTEEAVGEIKVAKSWLLSVIHLKILGLLVGLFYDMTIFVELFYVEVNLILSII